MEMKDSGSWPVIESRLYDENWKELNEDKQCSPPMLDKAKIGFYYVWTFLKIILHYICGKRDGLSTVKITNHMS